MSVIGDIRDALKAALENPTQTNLSTYDTAPDMPQVPCAVVFLDDPVWEPDTMNRGAISYHFIITILAGRVSESGAQNLLDGFLSYSGPSTIVAAIEADKTLGGTASSVFVHRATNYGPFKAGDTDYLGVQFHVEVRV